MTKTKKIAKKARSAGLKSLDGMTKARARVAIAKDVIRYLKAGWMTATPLVYVSLTPKPGLDRYDLFTDKDVAKGTEVRTVLRRRVEACDVCAKGALFVAHVLRFDRLKVDYHMVDEVSYGADDDPLENDVYANTGVSKYFTPAVLCEIEAFFESWDHVGSANALILDVRDAYPEPEDRLIALMQNIIDHGGRFVPKALLPPARG